MSERPAKKRTRRWIALVLLLLTLVLLRNPVLRSMGDFLVVQDELEQVDAIYVLSGNSFDRK